MSFKILIEDLLTCQLDEQTCGLKTVNDWAQKVVIIGLSVVKGVRSHISQGTILGPNLISSLISHLDDGADCMPR